jgi:hypothetical protein
VTKRVKLLFVVILVGACQPQGDSFAATPLLQSIDAGTKVVNETITLPHRGLLMGRSPAASTLKASGEVRGALVESERYAELIEKTPGAQWRADGLPQMLTVRDLLLDGGRELLDRAWETPADVAPLADGVRLFASGVELDDVKVANFLGAGVRLTRGSNPQRNGPWQNTDWESTRIRSLEISKCLDGLVVQSGADGKCDYIEASAIRGDGLQLGPQTGAWQFDKVHAFGCGRGVATLGGGDLFSILEVETCGVGWHNAATLSQVAVLKAFNCFRTAVYLERSAQVTNFVITAQQGEALRIGPGANSSRLTGVLLLGPQSPYVIDGKVVPSTSSRLAPVPPAKVVGATIEADNVELAVSVYGGQRPIVIPRPVVGLTLDLRLGPGADVGVEIPKGLGPGCRITIRHRNCKQPFVAGGSVPKGSIEVLEQ